MRLTSIYTKGDGVVRWERAIVEEADCVEVTGSHVGLIANRKAYRAIAARARAAGAAGCGRAVGRGCSSPIAAPASRCC